MDFIDKFFATFNKANFVELHLGGEIDEEEEKSFFPVLGSKKKLTVWDIEKILSAIEQDPKLQGVIIILSDLQVGFARANMLRARLLDLREAGKSVYVYIESGGNIEYLVASAADAVYLPPWGMLNLIGLKAEVTFYKDALSKIGVTANMKGFGEYKSAAETFTRDSMSEPHKEMINSIIGDLEQQLEEHISQGRGLEPKVVNAVINNGPYMPDSAVAAGLADGVLYENDLEEELSNLAGDKINLIKGANYLKQLNIKDKIRNILAKFGANYPVIAVVADSGMITLGSSKGSGPVKSLGSGSLNTLLDKIATNRRVKAIVLRVLSPGGSAVASDLICKKLEEISQTKPVIISMSDVAASGGYLISLGADKIVADSMTITGSIGIVSGKFDLSGLYSKLGVTKEFVLKANNALMYSPSKGFSKSEEKKLIEIMEFYYEKFVGRVSSARKMDLDLAQEVSKGRVWTGQQAKENGLIDELGGIHTAIVIAKDKALIRENSMPIVNFYSEPRGIKFSSLLNDSSVIDGISEMLSVVKSLEQEKILALMPYRIDLN